MKLGEVVVHIEDYNFIEFYYILMKKIIVLYQTHITDSPSIRGRLIWPKTIAKNLKSSVYLEII